MIESELLFHGAEGFKPEAPKIPYLFYPKNMTDGDDLFVEIYISMVRINDFSQASISSIVSFKKTEQLINSHKGFSKKWDIGNIFDPSNPLKNLSEDEEHKYLTEASEEYEKHFIENIVYSDDEFIDLYSKSIALILLYFSTINNLKKLIRAVETNLRSDTLNFNVRQQLASLDKTCEQQSKNIPEIKKLIFRLEGLINIFNFKNPAYSKKDKSFFISDHVINLGSLCEKIRDIRNQFSHGEWDLVKELIQDEPLPRAFKVVKRLYEACESACDWSLMNTKLA